MKNKTPCVPKGVNTGLLRRGLEGVTQVHLGTLMSMFREDLVTAASHAGLENACSTTGRNEQPVPAQCRTLELCKTIDYHQGSENTK